MDLETRPVRVSGERERLALEMVAALKRHVMDAWFPRCVDVERGGFISDFDRRWRRGPSSDRMLEFEARQTRVVARLAVAFPDDGRWQEYALHGFRFLRDRMWDSKHGGSYWMMSRDGEPLAGATKHAHSGAYAVQAGALVFEATGERGALELAEEGLDWFDRHAHDEQFGGFHNWLTREGQVIRSSEQVPAGADAMDPMGHEVGLKDVNVHGDWVETLLDVTVNSDSNRARVLLEEFTEIYLTHTTTPAGEVHYGFHPNWMPQPGPEWYGYGFEATQRMLSVAPLLPNLPELEPRARQIMLHTIRAARLTRGGFAYAGPAGPPASLEGTDMRVRARTWWVQFEGLRVLALYAAKEELPGPYTRRLRAHWRFINDNFLDERHGGVYSNPPGDLPLWRRLRLRGEAWETRKARDWKDASHETACLLESIAVLRGEARRGRGRAS
jgi:mannobiose 2-epimerase